MWGLQHLDNNGTATGAKITESTCAWIVTNCRVELPNQASCGFDGGTDAPHRIEASTIVGGGASCTGAVNVTSAYPCVITGCEFEGTWNTASDAITLNQGFLSDCAITGSGDVVVTMGEHSSMRDCSAISGDWRIKPTGFCEIANVWSEGGTGLIDIQGAKVRIINCRFDDIDLNTHKQTTMIGTTALTLTGLGNDHLSMTACHIQDNHTFTGDNLRFTDCIFADAALTTKKTLTLDGSSTNCQVKGHFGFLTDSGTGNEDDLWLMADIPALAAITWVHVWPFSEGSGTTVADSAGSNNGTLTNGPIWASGPRVGGRGSPGRWAVSFEKSGNNEHIAATTLGTIGAGDFTIFMWFRVLDGASTGTLCAFSNTANNQYANINFNTTYANPGISPQTDTSGAPTGYRDHCIHDAWHLLHVTRTFSSGDMSVYLDGELIYTDSAWDTQDHSGQDFYIHRSERSSSDTDGPGATISETGMTASVMSAANIRLHWNKGLGRWHGS